MENKFSRVVIDILPIVGFIFVYLSSVIFGALVLFYHIEPFYSVFIYHSGITLPVALTAEKMVMFWAVAAGSPAALVSAFIAAFLLVSSKLESAPVRIKLGTKDGPPMWIVTLFFFVSAGWTTFSLARSGAFDLLSTWRNYSDLVESRWQLFSRLSFFEFANLYQFLPTVAVAALLVGLDKRGWARLVGIACVFVALAVGVLIFQKRVLIITMLLVGVALIIRSYFNNPKRSTRLIGLAFGSILTIVIVFVLTSAVPMLLGQKIRIENSGKTLQTTNFIEEWRKFSADSHASAAADGDTSKDEELFTVSKEVETQAEKEPSRNDPWVISVVNLTMRTSVPSVYYVATFPDHHPFYSLDVGQDIAGIGTMPDDNLIVWNQMYPSMPGTVAAPYNFVLFSQGGLATTLGMSAVIGLIVGGVWASILWSAGPVPIKAALAAVIVVGTMHLAVDSMRNTAVVSYGFIWALVPLLLLLYIGRITTDRESESAKP